MLEEPPVTESKNTPSSQQTFTSNSLEKIPTIDPERQLKRAINRCRKKEIGVEEASIIYGVSKKTLRSELLKRNVLTIDEEYRVFAFNPFPKKAELNLIDCLRFLISSGASFTPVDVRRFAYESVYEIFYQNGLPKGQNCLLGRDWYKKFFANFSKIEPPVVNNYDNLVNDFFNTLESLVKMHKLEANRIFYVGGLELKFRAFGRSDLKFAGNKKTVFAKAICCMNPEGVFTPPIFLKPLDNCGETKQFEYAQKMYNLFKQNQNFIDKTLKLIDDFNETSNNVDLNFILMNKPIDRTLCDKLQKIFDSNFQNLPVSQNTVTMRKVLDILVNKSNPLSMEVQESLREQLYDEFNEFKSKIFSVYESTLLEVTPNTFFDWFHTFLEFVKPQQKVLLLVENQNYIKCFRTLQLAKMRNVIFLVVPPRLTYKFHPLDGFVVALNREIAMRTKVWLEENPNGKSEEAPMDSFFAKAFFQTKNPSIASNGFTFSGIWPINRNIFKSSESNKKSNVQQNNSEIEIIPSLDTCNNKSVFFIELSEESDIQKLCRICMDKKINMRPLFDVTSGHYPVPDKIFSVAEVTIMSNDGLPGSICELCLVQIKEVERIKHWAIESHKNQIRLRYILDRRDSGEPSSEIEEDVLAFLEKELQINPKSHPKLVNHYLTKDFTMDSVCTICMKAEPFMTSIYSKQMESVSTINTCEKIKELTQFVVHFHGGLSSFICQSCQAFINQALSFIRKVKSSDKAFKEIVAGFRKKKMYNTISK